MTHSVLGFRGAVVEAIDMAPLPRCILGFLLAVIILAMRPVYGHLTAPERPNFVFVLLDDMGWSVHAGNPSYFYPKSRCVESYRTFHSLQMNS